LNEYFEPAAGRGLQPPNRLPPPKHSSFFIISGSAADGCKLRSRRVFKYLLDSVAIETNRRQTEQPLMATPTSRRAPAADALIEERDSLCAELIALEREGQPRITRAAAIEASLKQIAGDLAER
jgi:hypothetical protein